MHTIWRPNLESNKPKYRALFDAIAEAVKTGTLEIEAKLPPIRELAYQLEITPATVVRAYQLAVDDGLLEARKGDGTYVKGQKREHHVIGKSDFMEESGYNLFARSAPEIGQTHLVNQLMGELASEGKFLTQTYLNNQERAEIRELCALWLQSDGLSAGADDVVITKGADNASSIALLILLKERKKITGLIEKIAYTGFMGKSFIGDVNFVGVEVDAGGVVPDAFRQMAKIHNPDFYIASSICANPISVTLSDERQEEIAEIAREYDIQIIDDILYGHLSHNRQQKSFRDFAPERVWTVTSLAKLGYPALNLGVLLPPKEQVTEATKMVDAVDVQINQLQYPICKALLQSAEFVKLKDVARDEVSARQALTHQYLDGFDYSLADGAAFLWLKMPENITGSQFLSSLAERQVRVAPAELFTIDKSPMGYVRLTLGGAMRRERFEEALQHVRTVLQMEIFDRVI